MVVVVLLAAMYDHLNAMGYEMGGERKGVLQCVVVWCSVLQCVAVCCSALQCVAVCCSVS